MIKNERQYRITKSRLGQFVERLNTLTDSSDVLEVVQRAAHQSQIESLKFDLAEYAALVEHRVPVLSVNSLAELPVALIKARIARGQTQKELAAALGVKEQQVQRWEAEEYEGTSLTTLKAVATALDLKLVADLMIVEDKSTVADLLRKLTKGGFGKGLLQRMLPEDSFAALTGTGGTSESLWKCLKELSAIFGVSIRRLIDPTGFFPLAGASIPRYKLSATADAAKVEAFTVYAHYIAALTCKALARIPVKPIPTTWKDFRRAVLAQCGDMTLTSALTYVWGCGVAVLPIRYSGAFHGAVWRIGGRNVIVLKQSTGQSARWLFDLLHEVGHIVNGHVTENCAVVESEPIGHNSHETDDEETAANEWAEDVLFDGRSDEIEKAVLKECRKDLRFLRSAVERVASAQDMEKGVLANHMAWRLSSEGTSWWGVAENMQKEDASPSEIVLRFLNRYVDLALLNELDREMFIQAISKA